MPDISTSLISGYSGVTGALQSPAAETGSDGGFAGIMSQALSLFQETGADSNDASLDLLTGNTEDLSSALIATEKAEISLNLTVAIRNKAIDAYKEIMNMQV
jgi:flagellar hook-basal body complex protein FliE